MYKIYSNKLVKQYSKYKFLNNFLKKVDLFFKDTYYISHGQFIFIKKQIIYISYFDNFESQINEIAKNALDNLYMNLCECINNITISYPEKNYIFKDINFASNETHNNKKSILIVKFNNNKIVYRPYNMAYLQILIKCFELIKFDLLYKNNLFPKILYFNNHYSIIEFIKTDKIINKPSFYYSIGVAMAFSYCFKITDLVGDNVIFSKKCLYIVDSEVCFYSGKIELSDIGLLREKSGLDSGLIEGFIKEIKINNDGKMLNFIKRRKSKKEQLKLQKYEKFILNGFKDCFSAILLNKNKILQITKERNMYVRYLARPTNVYANWLIDIFTPTDNIKNNLSKLYKTMNEYKFGDISEINSQIFVKAELKDLLLTDIPYFYCNAKSLWHKDTKIIDNFYKNDIILDFNNHLKKLNKISFKNIYIRNLKNY